MKVKGKKAAGTVVGIVKTPAPTAARATAKKGRVEKLEAANRVLKVDNQFLVQDLKNLERHTEKLRKALKKIYMITWGFS